MLKESARNEIANPDNLIIVSAAVIWEIRIKQALGKLEIASEFFQVIQEQGFEFLSITAEHAFAVGALPMYHRDPFDRMIIAQAQVEELKILTHDAMFSQYHVPLFII